MNKYARKLATCADLEKVPPNLFPLDPPVTAN